MLDTKSCRAKQKKKQQNVLRMVHSDTYITTLIFHQYIYIY